MYYLPFKRKAMCLATQEEPRIRNNLVYSYNYQSIHILKCGLKDEF